MKIPILALATNSGTLKEEFLRCFALCVSNETNLHGVVRNLAGAGVSKKTLTIWAVEAGYGKRCVSRLLSRIFRSLGKRERRPGAGRKPSTVTLELLAHAHDRYGEDFLKVLRAALRAGKARRVAPAVSDTTSVLIVVPELGRAGAYCGTTISRRPCMAQPTRVALRESLSNETSIRSCE
jgi:hypothetical protein